MTTDHDAKVREALVRVLTNASVQDRTALAVALRCEDLNIHRIAQCLLSRPAEGTGAANDVSPSDWRWLWRRCSVATAEKGWRFCADDDNPLPDFLAMRGLIEAHENGVWYREVERPTGIPASAVRPNAEGLAAPNASEFGDSGTAQPAPAVVTEAMVEAYKRERLAIARERYAAPGGVILTDQQADGQTRRLLTAALAARPEGE